MSVSAPWDPVAPSTKTGNTVSFVELLAETVTFVAVSALPVTLPVRAPTNVVAVTTPDTFNCFVNKVLPVTVVIPAKVETPATLKLSKFVWPSTSKSPFASILLEKDPDVASNAPLNVVAVTTPAILTLSNSECPVTSIPWAVVSNFLEFAWYIETAPLGIAISKGWFVLEFWSLIPVLLLKIKLPAPWALILEFTPSCPIIKSELSPNIATGALVLLIPLTASGNFIVSENVVTPVTFTLSKFVCPSTSKSALISTLPLNVEIPETFNLLRLIWLVSIPTVTIPATIGVQISHHQNWLFQQFQLWYHYF